MLTGKDLLRKVQSIDLTKEPREQKPPVYMDLVEKENQYDKIKRNKTSRRLL